MHNDRWNDRVVNIQFISCCFDHLDALDAMAFELLTDGDIQCGQEENIHQFCAAGVPNTMKYICDELPRIDVKNTYRTDVSIKQNDITNKNTCIIACNSNA